MLALPLVAALTLHATPLEMGLLGAAQSLPALVVGLPAGVWLDRARRRPVMVAAQAAEAIALATVPLAAIAGDLTLVQLYLVAFATGTGTALLRISQNAYLPALAGRARLVEANSHYQVSMTATGIVGPALAGVAVQVLTAPIAIAFDAASFVVGAVTSWAVRRPEPPPAERGTGARRLGADVSAGFRFLLGEPLLLSILATLVLSNCGGAVIGAVFALLFVKQLGVTPFQLGVMAAVGSAASLVGARLAKRLVDRFGLGTVIAVSAATFGAGQLAAIAGPLLPRPLIFPFMVATALSFAGLMVYNVNQQALRGALTPDHLLGRVNSAVYVAVIGLRLFAALLGGIAGQRYGLYPAFIMGSVIAGTGALPALGRATTSLRRFPVSAG